MLYLDGGGFQCSGGLLDANSTLGLTANTSTGGITPSIANYMTTPYDRPWHAWYDELMRLRAAIGYHSLDYATGQGHYRFEVKTSGDPKAQNPYYMATRFFIGTDQDDTTAGFSNITDLEIGHSKYEQGVGWGLVYYMPSANGASYTKVGELKAKLGSSDETIFEVQPMPFAATKSVKVRFFRDANTSGARTIEIMRGDGTNTNTVTINAATGAITTTGDVEITDATKGIILRSPSGKRFRMTVNDAGALSTSLL